MTEISHWLNDFAENHRARSLMVSVLHSETKDFRFEPAPIYV